MRPATLTHAQLEVIEGVLVDFLEASLHREGEVDQGTQVVPLVFNRLWEEAKVSITVALSGSNALFNVPFR